MDPLTPIFAARNRPRLTDGHAAEDLRATSLCRRFALDLAAGLRIAGGCPADSSSFSRMTPPLTARVDGVATQPVPMEFVVRKVSTGAVVIMGDGRDGVRSPRLAELPRPRCQRV
jgi:hypothetical protein